MKIAEDILLMANRYTEYTAQNLSELIRIPSLSGDEEKIIRKLNELLCDANFDDVRTDGLGNIIGRIGNGKKKLAYDAHIDTVDTGELSQWDFEPFSGEICDGFVCGRGAVDQKGGAAAMITAGRIIKELGYEGKFTIYFTFTIMEEDCDGLCWNYIIEREKLTPDFVILTEPTHLAVNRGHRGRMEADIIFTGVSAHGAMPERGDNAIYKASRASLKIEELNESLPSDDFLGKGTITVTSIISDSPSLCAVPDKCALHIDRRLTSGETMDSAISELQTAIGGDAKITVPVYDKPSYKGEKFYQKKYFPTWKLPEGHPLVRAGLRTAEMVLGQKPVIGKWNFSTNGVAICGKHKIPAIGFGPGNEIYAHAPNEKVPVEHLTKASALYALMPYILGETM